MINPSRAASIRAFIQAIATNSPNDRRAILKIVQQELNLPEEQTSSLQPPASTRVLPLEEAAQRFGLGVRWIQKQVTLGKLAAVKSGKRAIGVAETEIDRYIRDNQTPLNRATPQPQETSNE